MFESPAALRYYHDMSRKPLSSILNPRSSILACLALFALAFTIRLVYLLEIRDSALFSALVVDARGYDAWAREIAAGNWIGSSVFYQAPLYPYFLGSVYALFGHNLFVLRLVQIALGAAACVLLAVAGRRFFSPAAGLLAGLLLALYGPAVFFDCLVQKAVLGLFLTTLLLATLAGIHHAGTAARWWRPLCAGLVLGAFALTRENALVLFFVIVLYFAIKHRRSPRRKRLIRLGLFVAGLALVLAPVGLRNLLIGGRFLVTTAQFGPNFFIGNNHQATGVYVPLRQGRGSPEFERTDATELAEAELGRTLSPGEVSDFWAGKAFSYIRTQPGHWLRLMLRKTLLLWNYAELSDAEDLASYAEASALLRMLAAVFHFGLLTPLAVLGLALTWHDRRRLWLLYLMLVSLAASVVIFYVFARYRFPIVPILTLFAGAALCEARTRIAQKAWRTLVLPGILALLAALVCNLRLVATERLPAATRLNFGNTLLEQGRYEEALAEYGAALQAWPDSADLHNNIGVTLSKLKRHPEALSHFSRVLRIQPHYPRVHLNIGLALERTGQFEQAVAHLESAVRAQPKSADALIALGRALAATGKHAAAARHFSSVLRLGPDPARAEAHAQLGRSAAKNNRLPDAIAHLARALELAPQRQAVRTRLAMLLVRSGRLDEAATLYAQAVQRAPDDAGLHSNLGAVLYRQGRLEQAAQHFSEALRIQPNSPEAHNNLGAVHAQNGRFEQALRHFSAVLKNARGAAGPHANLARTYLQQAQSLAQAGRKAAAQTAAGNGLLHAQTAKRADLIEALSQVQTVLSADN